MLLIRHTHEDFYFVTHASQLYPSNFFNSGSSTVICNVNVRAWNVCVCVCVRCVCVCIFPHKYVCVFFQGVSYTLKISLYRFAYTRWKSDKTKLNGSARVTKKYIRMSALTLLRTVFLHALKRHQVCLVVSTKNCNYLLYFSGSFQPCNKVLSTHRYRILWRVVFCLQMSHKYFHFLVLLCFWQITIHKNSNPNEIGMKEEHIEDSVREMETQIFAFWIWTVYDLEVLNWFDFQIGSNLKRSKIHLIWLLF